MYSQNNKRPKILFNHFNQFTDDKFDQVQQEQHNNKQCMSQRDKDDFNDDLNIFTAKYKIYENVNFSPSFFKNDKMKSTEEYQKDSSLEQSNFKYQTFEQRDKKQNYFELNDFQNSSKENYNFINNVSFQYHMNSNNTIFSDFSCQNNENKLQNAGSQTNPTRMNIFQKYDQEKQYYINQEETQQPKIIRRDMSVEMEYGQIPEYKINLQEKKILIQKSNQNQIEQNIDQFDIFQSNQKKKKIINFNSQDSYQKNMNEKIYETPYQQQNKKRGNNSRVIESSFKKISFYNENSNQSSNQSNQIYQNRDTDTNYLNPTSIKKYNRKSTNHLHSSFQKQIFDKSNCNRKSELKNSFQSNYKMKSEKKQYEFNDQSIHQSRKLRKLVKNKRKSEVNAQKNEDSCQSQGVQNCAICLCYPQDNIYGQIKCMHEFCFDCIVQWSTVTNQCPMCRLEFNQIVKKNYNDYDDNDCVQVEQKKQRIQDDDEFYWEEGSFLDDDGVDELCYICETNSDETKLIVCDHCGIRICHTYCDDDLIDDSFPDEWFCHECRVRSELFY